MVAVSRLAIDRRFSCRSPGTLPTDAIQFVLLIVGTVLNLGLSPSCQRSRSVPRRALFRLPAALILSA